MRKVILVTCNSRYSEILSNAIVSIQKYATRIEADLHISYGGFPYIDRYEKLLEFSDIYTHAAYIDCDCFVSNTAPDIFDCGVNSVAFKPVEKENRHVQNVCRFCKEFFGPDFDRDYYCFGGVFVGPLPILKDLSRKVIDLYDTVEDKSNNFFLKYDEVYLTQVLAKHYPDFERLDTRWIINSELALSGADFYIAHPFLKMVGKAKELQRLRAKFDE